MWKVVIALVALLATSAPSRAHAQQLIETYIAHLSERDHFNSNGERLVGVPRRGVGAEGGALHGGRP